MAWYDVQKQKPHTDSSVDLLKLVEQTSLLPAVSKAMLITLTLPSKNCSVDRSFSTMRRAKTAKFKDERLSGLCMLSDTPEKRS